MELIKNDDGSIVLIDVQGNVVNPQDPAAVDYVINRYNSLLKGMRKIELDLKMAGFKSTDQLNLQTEPDVDNLNVFNASQGNDKTHFSNVILQMTKDNYAGLQELTDQIRKYISDNNIDYGTVDENGFIVKKDAER